MKTQSLALVFSLATFAYAQDISDLPSCSLNCFVSTLGSDGCSSLTDFDCHCKKPGLVSSVTPCVEAACSVADHQTVIDEVEAICKSKGVTLSIAPISSSAVSSVASSVASATSALASSSVVTTSAVAVSSSAVVGTPYNTPTYAGTSATPTPSSYQGAANKLEAAGGVLGAVLAVMAVVGL